MISVETLKNASIFENLDGETLNEIASIGYEEIFQSEETIFEEGDKAENIYVVIKGRVFIHTGFDVKLGSVVVDTVRDGDIFGWSALTENRSFTASAKAADKTWLAFINGEKLLQLCSANEHVGFVIMKGMLSVASSRLLHTLKRFKELIHSRRRSLGE